MSLKASNASVNIVERRGSWIVVIFDLSSRMTEQSFETEAFADSFAAGQRARYGIPQVSPDVELKTAGAS